MKTYYDRYQHFRQNGQVSIIPDIYLDEESTDIKIIYDKNKMRLDMLSYKYYGDPNFGWLIMLANLKYGSLEFNIPDGVLLTIPYPLNVAIGRYETKIKEILKN